jgi:hypothetical protein
MVLMQALDKARGGAGKTVTNGYKFSKVSSIVALHSKYTMALHSKYTRALTFENLSQMLMPALYKATARNAQTSTWSLSLSLLSLSLSLSRMKYMKNFIIFFVNFWEILPIFSLIDI